MDDFLGNTQYGVLKYHIVYFRNNINVMLRNSLFTVYGNYTFLRTNDFDIMNGVIKLYFYLFFYYYYYYYYYCLNIQNTN